MEPRKSKALIITFIIVLTLLIVGYFVVVRGGLIKSDSAIGKRFAPLLGTPKQKDVVVTDPSTTPPVEDPSTETPGTNPDDLPPTNPDDGPDSGKPTPIPKYVPPNLSFPKPDFNTPKTPSYNYNTQCSDGKDNDKDGSIDSSDDDCHSDGNAKNPTSYTPTYNTEFGSKNLPVNTVVPSNPNTKVISCDVEQIPLSFTAEEQAQLDELTREFYRLAPQLKTENDIVAEISSNQGYNDIITNAKELTKQCWDTTSTPTYLRNDINREVIGQQQVQVFTKEEQDFLEKYGGYGNNATLSGKTPDEIRSSAWQQVDVINSSTLDKGRTERRATRYYNPLEEYLKNPIGYTKGGSTSSYYQAYFINPLTGLPEYSWKDWEEIRQIAYPDKKRTVASTATSTLASNFIINSKENTQSCTLTIEASNQISPDVLSYEWIVTFPWIQSGYFQGFFSQQGKYTTNTPLLYYPLRTDKQASPIEYADVTLNVKDANGNMKSSMQKVAVRKSSIKCQ
jgi:hypothetical protein